MARVRYMQVVDQVFGRVRAAVSGAPWEVRLRGSATPVTFYAAESGGSGFAGTVSNLAVVNGRVEAASPAGGELWLESGVSFDEYTTANGLAVAGGNPLVKVGADEAVSALDSGLLGTAITDIEELRELKAERDRLPAVDARDYDGIFYTDDDESTTGLQLLIQESTDQNRRSYLPAGDIMVRGVQGRDKLHLMGAPGFATRLILLPEGTPGFTTGAIFGTGTAGLIREDMTFENLVFDGQQQERTISTGNALLKCYNAERLTMRLVWIRNGTQYGLGFQSYPGEDDPNKRHIITDVDLELCYFTDNGWIGGTVGVPRSGTNNSADNMDIKSSNRVVMKKVYSAYSSDPCLDLRCQRGDLFGCVFVGSATANVDLTPHRRGPGALDTGPPNDNRITLHGGMSFGSLGAGVAAAPQPDSDAHIELVAFTSINNGGSGVATNPPSDVGRVYVRINGGEYSGNAGHGVAIDNGKYVIVGDAEISGNELGAILFIDQVDGAVVKGNQIRDNEGYAVESTGTSDRIIIDDNAMPDNNSTFSLVGNQNIIGKNDMPLRLPTKATAPTVTLDRGYDDWLMTGTTTITDLTRSDIGREVTLVAAAGFTISNATVVPKSGSSIVVAIDTAVKLKCISTSKWVQV